MGRMARARRARAEVTLRLDHLVVRARTLEEGAAWVEAALGVPPGPGGRHEAMGTHNRLLSLGPDEYLEVIAIDPDARAPDGPRWFGLDGFDGPPALAAWVLAAGDLDRALAALPVGMGAPMDLARGALRWRMAPAPPGPVPSVIEWRTGPPAPGLPDGGCRLRRLSVAGPEAPALREILAPLMAPDPRLLFGAAGAPAMRAHLDTPSGPRTLDAAEP